MKHTDTITKAGFDNTAFIIPVYNSSDFIEKLLYKLQLCGVSVNNIVFVNDGSIDNSLDIIKKTGAPFIDLPVNCGKGFALKKGFQYAKDNNYLFAITLDSDLQHDPFFINNFFRTQNHFNSDIVIGFRHFNFTNMPFARVLSNKITSFIVGLVCRQIIMDSQSGYRLYNLNYFREEEIVSNRYQMETEILLRYLNKGAKLSHTEISVIYGEEKSHISHLRDIKNFIKVVLKEIKNEYFINK